MLESSTTGPPPAESTGAHARLVDGTVVQPAELSELVGIFRAVLPDSTDDEARRVLDSEVVQGTNVGMVLVPSVALWAAASSVLMVQKDFPFSTPCTYSECDECLMHLSVAWLQ